MQPPNKNLPPPSSVLAAAAQLNVQLTPLRTLIAPARLSDHSNSNPNQQQHQQSQQQQQQVSDLLDAMTCGWFIVESSDDALRLTDPKSRFKHR